MENVIELAKNLPSFERKPDEDFVHHFLGFGIHKSRVGVQIWIHQQKAFILFQDLGNDSGTSITNAAEQVIQEIYFGHLYCRGIKRENCLFIETYDRHKDGLDVIIPQWSGDTVADVDWRHLGKVIKNK